MHSQKLLKHMPPEKLQAIAVYFDRTPGMGINQLAKVDLQKYLGEIE
jgi:hypothetical protein